MSAQAAGSAPDGAPPADAAGSKRAACPIPARVADTDPRRPSPGATGSGDEQVLLLARAHIAHALALVAERRVVEALVAAVLALVLAGRPPRVSAMPSSSASWTRSKSQTVLLIVRPSTLQARPALPLRWLTPKPPRMVASGLFATIWDHGASVGACRPVDERTRGRGRAVAGVEHPVARRRRVLHLAGDIRFRYDRCAAAVPVGGSGEARQGDDERCRGGGGRTTERGAYEACSLRAGARGCAPGVTRLWPTGSAAVAGIGRDHRKELLRPGRRLRDDRPLCRSEGPDDQGRPLRVRTRNHLHLVLLRPVRL